MKKKHIIWDFNGTLLNDAQLSVDCDNHVFDELGLPHITIEDYRAHMTMPVRDFYTALGIDLNIYPYETIARIWLDMFNGMAVSCGLVPGALEAIDRLAAAGHSQSILSATYEPDLRMQCEGLKLSSRMRVINGLSDESARKKTDIGRAQIKALGKLAADKSRCALKSLCRLCRIAVVNAEAHLAVFEIGSGVNVYYADECARYSRVLHRAQDLVKLSCDLFVYACGFERGRASVS